MVYFNYNKQSFLLYFSLTAFQGYVLIYGEDPT